MQAMAATKANYDAIYAQKRVFLRYPADWIIRFHNMTLRDRLAPGAKVLDYGCGSGNNAVFFTRQGYDVTLSDITKTAQPLVDENFIDAHMAPRDVAVLDPTPERLPWPDATFDFVVSNQVLYYLPSYAELSRIAAELHRVTKPGGLCFLTMIGPKNYYITDHVKSVRDGVHEVFIGGDHRLAGATGYHEFILVPRDEDHLAELMQPWTRRDIGYFDQRMGDMTSNFHWIFVGEKN